MCLFPIRGWYSRTVNGNGKRSLLFKLAGDRSDESVMVPCGRCIQCRLKHARMWAVRCMHEKRMHRESCFVTLTYDDDHLPRDGGLDKYALQCFMKRLRKVRPAGLRFFACGEYGEVSYRPHYHLLLFNTDFPDKRFYRHSESGQEYYRSAELSRLWPNGDNIVGGVSFDSACYVAGYCVKKFVGELADEFYCGLTHPFVVMSRRPGIGSTWYDKYKDEAFKHDSAIMSGREVSLPRFYNERFKLFDSERYAVLSDLRKQRALDRADDNTYERRVVRERVALLNSRRFVRDVR